MNGQATQADVQIILDLIDKTKAKIDKRLNKIATQSKITSKGIESLDKEFNELERTQRVLDKVMGKTRQEFAGWALSLMFFGMALKQAFDSIWRAGSKTFNEVMHSVEGTATGFDMLEGSLKYLGFTMGQALEPLAFMLVPIIDKVSNWIVQNDSLFRGIVAALGVGGTVLTAFGMGKLALDGLLQAMVQLKIATNTAHAKMLAFKGLAGAVGVYLTMDAISDFQAGEAFDGTISALEAAGFFALASGKKGLAGAAIGLGIALEFTKLLLEGGGTITREALAQWMIKAGAMAAFVNPGVGAALLTIGVAMELVDSNIVDQVINALGVIVGSFFVLAAAVADTILTPITEVVNFLIRTYNMLVPKGLEMKTFDYSPMLPTATGRVTELIDEIAALQGRGPQPYEPETTSYYRPGVAREGVLPQPIEITLVIDGEPIKKVVTDSIFDEVENS